MDGRIKIRDTGHSSQNNTSTDVGCRPEVGDKQQLRTAKLHSYCCLFHHVEIRRLEVKPRTHALTQVSLFLKLPSNRSTTGQDGESRPPSELLTSRLRALASTGRLRLSSVPSFATDAGCVPRMALAQTVPELRAIGWATACQLLAAVCLVALACKVASLLVRRRASQRHYELFPGPRAHWLFGHVLEVGRAHIRESLLSFR